MSNTQMDPFEEFEFRPINEGLGFHGKRQAKEMASDFTVPTGRSTFTSPLPRNTLTAQPARNELTQPAPMTGPAGAQSTHTNFYIPTIEDDSIAKAQTAVNEILKNLNHKRQVDFMNEAERERAELKKSKPYFSAAALDTMLILASFLFTMIIMLTITKVDLIQNLTNADSSPFVFIATAGLFLSVYFIYMTINRVFMGFTPGEWAFDQNCGSYSQMKTAMYPIKVAARSIIVMLTGFVILPLLSYLLNRDLAGAMSGVSLMRK